MKYRNFGRLDFKVSALGFGAMRLPYTGNPSNVVEPEAIKMLRYAIDNGVNYLDSAYLYHGGLSEVIVGKALQDGYRQKVRIATKMPCPMVQKTEDFDRIFDEQLKRLQTDKIDFYLLHGVDQAMFVKMRDLKYLPWAEKKMADGKIGHLGFSFHDTYKAFKEIIDAYDGWSFCQIQYNYMDVNYQAGTRGLKYAADQGLAVVVMEPLRGGRLAKEPPREIANLWASAGVQRSPAEWGLLWVWDHPEVSVVLSGMSSLEQITQNLASSDRSGPGVLTAADLAMIDKVRRAYRKKIPVQCTGCRYCMPCPNGVDIPRVFELYNGGVMYDDPVEAIRAYSRYGIKPEQRADKCVVCEKCLEKCPQKLAIPELLSKAHEYLMPKT